VTSVLLNEQLWTFGRTVMPLTVASSSPRSISPLTQYHIPEDFNPLNTKLNPICHLLALLGAHHIFHVSGIRVNLQQHLISCKFEVVTTLTFNNTVYWDEALSSLVDQYQYFGANC